MAQLATQCEADALDIVQDAMFKLAEKYASRPSQEWKALFLTILESKIIDWHRKQTLKRKLFFWKKNASETDTDISDDDGHNLGSGEFLRDHADPESIAMSEQLGQQLLDKIAALPLQQQQCFLLRSWEGLSITETAEIMKINENSVKTHYARALIKLKEPLLLK